jgi:hypothetical protein
MNLLDYYLVMLNVVVMMMMLMNMIDDATAYMNPLKPCYYCRLSYDLLVEP